MGQRSKFLKTFKRVTRIYMSDVSDILRSVWICGPCH